MDKRFNAIGAIFGQRGTGKTDYLRGNPQHNLEGLMNIYPKYKNMKVLIIDTFDHPSYSNVPVLKPDEFKKWQSGIYRIFTYAEDIPKLNRFINSSPSIYNTLLVYEDAYKHTSGKVDKSLRQILADSKQKNIDIVFMYHSFAQAPPDIYRLIDYIELFKTKDSPKCRESFMPGYFDEAMKVYNSVKQNKNTFYHELITTELS